MPKTQTGETQLLDRVLEFFADGTHWIRGHYHDGDARHCLVGAVLYLSRKHRLPAEPVMSLLRDAMPRRGLGLIHFNDHHCCSVAELRSVIVEARRLADERVEQERAAATVERWLLMELEKERAARAAADDNRETWTLGPRARGKERLAA